MENEELCAVLTKDECESLLDWMDTSLIQFIRDEASVDNMQWLCNMASIYEKVKKVVDNHA